MGLGTGFNTIVVADQQVDIEIAQLDVGAHICGSRIIVDNSANSFDITMTKALAGTAITMVGGGSELLAAGEVAIFESLGGDKFIRLDLD